MSSLNCAIINRYKIASTQTRRKMRWDGVASSDQWQFLSQYLAMFLSSYQTVGLALKQMRLWW